MNVPYDTPLENLLHTLLSKPSNFPSDFTSVAFFDKTERLTDEVATRSWYDLNFTIENVQASYLLFQSPNAWRCILYIGFSNNFYMNYSYILSIDNQSFTDKLLSSYNQYEYAFYQQYMPSYNIQHLFQNPSQERVDQLLQHFILPFCDYYKQRIPPRQRLDDKELYIQCLQNCSTAEKVMYIRTTLHFAPLQDILQRVNQHTQDLYHPTEIIKNAGHKSTLDFLFQHHIIKEGVMDVLQQPNEPTRNTWFETGYAVNNFIADEDATLTLHEWYRLLFLGYYNNHPLQITPENFHQIFNLYKSMCATTFKPNPSKEDPTLQNLIDIFKEDTYKHSYLYDMNFFDVMFLRPFLQWKCQVNIPSYFQRWTDVANTFQVNNDSTLARMADYDVEVILLRYSLLNMHFTTGFVEKKEIMKTEFRDRKHISSCISKMTELISKHKINDMLYFDFIQELEIEPSTSFQTVMEKYFEDQDQDQLIDVVLYDEDISGVRFVKSTGVGLVKQWLTEHYTSTNVLSLLKKRHDIPMQTILNFGYKHNFGLVIDEDLFYFLVTDLYNNNTLSPKKIEFRFEHVVGVLWYLISDAKEYNIDLFLQAALNTDYKEYCQGTLREEDDNPGHLKSYVQEDYDVYFDTVKDFIDEYLCSDEPPVFNNYNLETLNTELRAIKIPYFSQVMPQNAKYLRSLYAHFINVTYDVTKLSSAFSQEEPLAAQKVITALSSFSEKELQDFVMTTTSLRSFPKHIKVTTYEHANDTSTNNPNNLQNDAFQFHTCTNHLEFPRQFLQSSDDDFANYLKNSLMTRFTILGGSGDERIDLRYLVCLLRSLLLTFVLGTTLQLLKDESKMNMKMKMKMKNTTDMYTIIAGVCIFIIYTVVIFLEYTNKTLLPFVYAMDITALIYIGWVLS